MSGTRFRILPSLQVLILMALIAVQTASSLDGNFTGTVKSSDGKLLEGVAVSARADGKTFTTTVYTDLKGEYFSPPLEAGQFTIRAQAVGFQAGKTELKLSASQTMRQDFTLQPLKDFGKQLSGTEWMASLPEDTPQDRRMKVILQRNCSSCHVSSFILDNRFDASGWGTILNLMSRIGVYAFTEREEAAADPAIQMYKEELVSYLVRLRGPDSLPLKFKPLPRPTGDAAQVVVTEYDIPQGDKPGYISKHNGSDWSEGMPSAYEGRAIHDLFVDKEGNVWIGNTIPLGRTLAKMDQRTGRFTDYTVLAAEDNKPLNARGIVKDREGNIWFISSPNGRPEGDAGVVKFNPTTEKFQVFPRPQGFPRMGFFPALDSKGNVWYESVDGAVKLDPKTEKFTRYTTTSTTGEKPYECAVDAKDTVWCTMMNSGRIVVIDSETNRVSEIALAPLQNDDNEKDREISARLARRRSNQGDDVTQNRETNVRPTTTPSTSYLHQKGPRRLVVDRTANAVWIALYWGGGIAKIDTNSRKVTEYRLPTFYGFYSSAYGVAVDKNHMVWINLMNSDRIAKFNPFTEQFTEYPLPTLGTEPRHITVDDSTDPPTVWVPYYRVNKIARVQFRTVTGPTPGNGQR